MVCEVTDDKSLPKETRKAHQVESAGRKSGDAALIKLADKTSNLWAIAASPAPSWSVRRRLEYIAFAKSVVEGLPEKNSYLVDQFENAVRDAERSVRLEPTGNFRPLK